MPKAFTSQKHATSPLVSAMSVSSSALLVVDQAPFLEKALATCLRLREELHQSQKLLSVYEDEDRAEFQRWLHRTHGFELTRIRESWDEIADYQFILQQLSECADHDYTKIPQLYKELLQLKAQGTLLAYTFVADDDWNQAWDYETWHEPKDDPLRAFFDKVFGRAASYAKSSKLRDRASSAKKAKGDACLKACYRALAKRLHPDHSELADTIREKRWHEMQVAYQAGSLEALLHVEAVCDMEDTGLTVDLGLARLRDLTSYHQSHLLPIRQALKNAVRDRAFGFATTGATNEVIHAVAHDLESQYYEVQERIIRFAQAAASVRDEVESQLRENEIAAARTARRDEKLKAKRARTE